MSDQFVRWYKTRTSTERFERLVTDFAAAGIALNNPVHGCPMVLNADSDQVEVSAADIGKWIGLAVAPINVQWWISPTVDVICFFDFEPLSWEVQTYYLDGLSSAQMQKVESLILAQVEARPDETLAVIVDERGATAEFDWDQFMRDPAVRIDPLPEALVLVKGDARIDALTVNAVKWDLGSRHEVIAGTGWRANSSL